MHKSPPGRLLIISIRRIGDVLLTTPLIRTLKQHWPESKIDVLVFKGTQAILAANSDIHNIITIEEYPDFSTHLRLIQRIFRAYDLAVSTLPGDRATLYAYFASPYRVGMLNEDKSRWWKSLLLSKAVAFDNISTHTVLMNLRLAESLKLTPLSSEVVLSWQKIDAEIVSDSIDLSKKLAILHLQPKFSYKAWTQESWLTLANWLKKQGYTLVFTGDKTELEKKMATEVINKLSGDVVNMVGHLSLNQLAFLLSHAKVYVGPDTVVTHMAAALGIPTIALFGPTNPVKWGPWPKTWTLSNPFIRVGSQRRKNVYLVQGLGSCVPCFKEGCDQHIKSRSHCLERLTAQHVIDKVNGFIN